MNADEAAGKRYIVRAVEDDQVPDRIHPGTLRGLLAGMEDASLRSLQPGAPQELIMMRGKVAAVIRRYDHGHEVPVTHNHRSCPSPGSH